MKKLIFFILCILFSSTLFSQVKISELTLTSAPDDSAMFVVVWDSSGTKVSRRFIWMDIKDRLPEQLVWKGDTLKIMHSSGTDTLYVFDDGDTTRFESPNPFKIGSSSLVVSTDSLIIPLAKVRKNLVVGSTENTTAQMLITRNNIAGTVVQIENDASGGTPLLNMTGTGNGTATKPAVRFNVGAGLRGLIGFDEADSTLDVQSYHNFDLISANNVQVVADTFKLNSATSGLLFPDGTLQTTANTVGVNGWTDDGTVIRLSTSGDDVAIGKSTADGKLYVYESADSVQVNIESDGYHSTLNLDATDDEGSSGNVTINLKIDGTTESRIRHNDNTNVLSITNATGAITLTSAGDITLSSNEKVTISDTLALSTWLKFQDGNKLYTPLDPIQYTIEQPDTLFGDTLTIWKNPYAYAVYITKIEHQTSKRAAKISLFKRSRTDDELTTALVDTTSIKTAGYRSNLWITTQTSTIDDGTIPVGWELVMAECDSSNTFVQSVITWRFAR